MDDDDPEVVAAADNLDTESLTGGGQLRGSTGETIDLTNPDSEEDE